MAYPFYALCLKSISGWGVQGNSQKEKIIVCFEIGDSTEYFTFKF